MIYLKNQASLINQISDLIEVEAGPILTQKHMFDLVAKKTKLLTSNEDLLSFKNIYANVKSRYQHLNPLDHALFPNFEIYTKTQNVDLYFLSTAFSYNHTYSHFSALFLNGLTNQRPSDIYLSKYSLITRDNKSDMTNIDVDYLKMLFQKSPKITSKQLQYKKNDIFFIEKERKEEDYTEKLKIELNGYSFNVQITNKEKTIIDSVISPHYAGGVTTIFQAFENFKDIDLDKLYDVYVGLNPIYPYWQNIGFYIEKANGVEAAKIWKDKFNNIMFPFYLSRNYEDKWVYNENWKLSHPDIF